MVAPIAHTIQFSASRCSDTHPQIIVLQKVRRLANSKLRLRQTWSIPATLDSVDLPQDSDETRERECVSP